MMADETCELLRDEKICERPAEMEFNFLSPGGMFQAHVCMDCWGEAESDSHVMVDVLKGRAGAAGLKLPVPIERLHEIWPELERQP